MAVEVQRRKHQRTNDSEDSTKIRRVFTRQSSLEWPDASLVQSIPEAGAELGEEQQATREDTISATDYHSTRK